MIRFYILQGFISNLLWTAASFPEANTNATRRYNTPVREHK